ncbi:MAG: glutamate synthase subunit alpha [Candidatus Hydrogenedentes bacterium CG1_02_42_14]|nr:MAG: glutamate synthase subunit alpha [Candidatus Hydrogenedentes bacterium CG1_02_42_14]
MKSRWKKEGLYDPNAAKGSCGVGFLVDMYGRKSHDIVEKGIEIVENLTHRGACGCDPRTGDGAGIMVQIPDDFFRKVCSEANGISGEHGFDLPPIGQYGIGMFFLPQFPTDRHFCEGIIEEVIEEEGLTLLGWRNVPANSQVIGEFAQDLEPRIKQVFVKATSSAMSQDSMSQDSMSQDAFERKLYVVRKRIQSEIRRQLPNAFHYFYIPSFSTRTVVYKGMLIAQQIKPYFLDLSDPDFTSAIAMVHQRYSTNTFPTWDLSHPFRYLCHNGEINTLKGNINWMSARESMLESELFGEDIKKISPIVLPMGSDSAMLDNALEFLLLTGRSLPHAAMMLIPEAWENDESMDSDRRGFYEYHAAMMEPWDGPACVAFSDGRAIGAMLDRNGLRPARYKITKSGLVVLASEAGVLEIPESEIISKGRLQPGRILLVDTVEQRIINDEELKETISKQKPYKQWVAENKISLQDLGEPPPVQRLSRSTLLEKQQLFGYTVEDLKFILGPIAEKGEEPVGSMGTDTPPAVLSDHPQLLFNYFKQNFAQVTNPPIDPIREKLVMSLSVYVGGEGNFLKEEPRLCHQIELPHPILTNNELERIRHFSIKHFRAITLPTIFHAEEGGVRLRHALNELCQRASDAVRAGYSILILSDRQVDAFRAPIPSLLAVGAVHQHLVREGSRTKVGIIVESGEPREVHHTALLIGYGASAVNPYLVFDTLSDMVESKFFSESINYENAEKNYIKAINKGLLKVMSKMGISTIFSYHGAQIFEALGINQEVIDEFFTKTPSRIGGIGLDVIADEARLRHERAYPRDFSTTPRLDIGGQYQWRRDGEKHLIDPDTISKLQHAVRTGSFESFEEYSHYVNETAQKNLTLRSLLKFTKRNPIQLDEIEPAKDIVKRFATGAMSFGSISKEAHQALAAAMNRLGGRSNTGEGGEDPLRFKLLENGDSLRSSIKQVASGRFGVTTEYLINADELQIKIAQGAKPGEGGQLPGHKVSEDIARVRHSTPGVALISPPPHHDIYSIEDLAQLIFDLKNVNPRARISVKLVSENGVGTVAAGVSKAKADVVLISGYEGGTGASPISSIKHAGIPWEIGLAETHQVLVKNDLRGRIIVQTDGKLCTGRDVAIAALLGAEEFGFATIPLISMGCIMMRKCHLNTCPVGVATQDPELRKKFAGKPEHVVNFFFFIAEELRRIMADLGFRTVNEMIGRVDHLKADDAIDHWKAKYVDLSALLYRQRVPKTIATRCIAPQDHMIDDILDLKLIELCKPALNGNKPVKASFKIRNVNRTIGAMLSGEIAKRCGNSGLPDHTIHLQFEGSAGQSFGAWAAKGLTLELTGESNDYLGKGLSGGIIIVKPPEDAGYIPEENIIIGNVCLYGATSGECYIRGLAGERFAVRNSGAHAVVEGVGDHGCEYMTGGVVVVLGSTGKNFAAGMSGGIAYVFDENNSFAKNCNKEMVDFEAMDDEDIRTVRKLVEKHLQFTNSSVAKRIIDMWDESIKKLKKIMPHDYRRVLNEMKQKSLGRGN